MRTLLAAVVLNYRTPELTLGAVESLLRSERQPDRISIVDNGSQDHSATLLGAIAGTSFVALEKNLGFSGGVNAGVQRALDDGAGLVLLVNSDARLTPGCLGRLEAELERDPLTGITGPILVTDSAPDVVESAGIRYWPDLGVMRNVGAGRLRGQLSDVATSVEAVSGCVMLIRREVFQRIGLFAEDYFYSFEDLDFCLRAAEAGFFTRCCREATARHVGAASIGQESPRRLYFAARNHLLLAGRAKPMSQVPALLRGTSIATLNVAHALLTSGGPRWAGLAAVARGIADHLKGRYGEGPDQE